MMMNNKTAREIVIDLIDRKEITGEEAYTLIYELVNKNNCITWTNTNTYPSWSAATTIDNLAETCTGDNTYTVKGHNTSIF